MQRAKVMVAVLMLVVVALAAGVLISHWPFWARAWQWQASEDGWPVELPGAVHMIAGGADALPLDIQPVALPAFAASSESWILAWASADGRGGAYFAPGYSLDFPLDGRGMAAGLLAPLYGVLAASHPGLLDEPVRRWFEHWQDDDRGVITPRQLLWQLSGLPAGDFHPLNPFSPRAQLASGPDFERAIRHWPQTWPAGSHYEISPANPQLLAVAAARESGVRYSQLLQEQLWSQVAAADASALLDHARGDIAAHCCFSASAGDWLRLGLLIADDGRVGARQVLPAGFVARMAEDSPVHPGFGLGYRVTKNPAGETLLVLESEGRQLLIAPGSRRAVLWAGAGAPPAGLHQLLAAETASRAAPSVTP